MQPTITIRATTKEDLPYVMDLWNNGDVMRYVGYPEGLGVTLPQLNRWLEAILAAAPERAHYSIFDESGAYCGETHYHVDTKEHAAMDIKLLPSARGQGIAFAALSFAINRAFEEGGALSVHVDPDPQNNRALALYSKLGFVKAPWPSHLEPSKNIFMQITKASWDENKSNVLN